MEIKPQDSLARSVETVERRLYFTDKETLVLNKVTELTESAITKTA